MGADFQLPSAQARAAGAPGVCKDDAGTLESHKLTGEGGGQEEKGKVVLFVPQVKEQWDEVYLKLNSSS